MRDLSVNSFLNFMTENEMRKLKKGDLLQLKEGSHKVVLMLLSDAQLNRFNHVYFSVFVIEATQHKTVWHSFPQKNKACPEFYLGTANDYKVLNS